MRILHLDEQRGWRGGEQQASYLIRGSVQRGHDVFIAGRWGSEFLTRNHEVTPAGVASLPFMGELDLYTAARLAHMVRHKAIDIFHAHTSHAHSIACLARGLAGMGAVVVSRRVDFPPSNSAWSRWKYTWPDRFVAVSGRIAAVLEAASVPRDRIAVVHSAIDTSRFEVEALRRAELGAPEDAFLIGNVAALVDHKDHVTLLRAMSLVVGELPRAHLAIAGAGPLRDRLVEICEEHGLTAHVHFLGYRQDVPRLMRTLDLFVMSSKEEGLGTSILDAMACRVPVVATAGGGIPEMVRDGVTGWLAPVGDHARLAEKILGVARDRPRAGAVADSAYDMVCREFHVDRMVEGNLAVYAQVLAERS